MGRAVLRVQLKHGTLEVLHGICLTVSVASLLYLCADCVALLGEVTVRVPVQQELAADALARLLKQLAVTLGGTAGIMLGACEEACQNEAGNGVKKAYLHQVGPSVA